MIRRPPRPTLFPYTTLFRSLQECLQRNCLAHHVRRPALTFPGPHPSIPAALELCSRVRKFERGPGKVRSEEHMSELQSRLHLVCRLLLEKKKNRQYCKRAST